MTEMLWAPIIDYNQRLPYDSLTDARIYPSRYDLLSALPIPNPCTVAEIGVAFGDFSTYILCTCQPQIFTAIDTFTLHQWEQPAYLMGKNIHEELAGQTHLAFYQNRFPTADITRGLSWEALETYPDNHFDFAYLDAAHDYDSVTRDIQQLRRTVKPGGHIMFDDYTNWDIHTNTPYGVMQAVNEYIQIDKPDIIGIALNPNGFHNIAVRTTQ
jgi:SAM-dependent methyltransferase